MGTIVLSAVAGLASLLGLAGAPRVAQAEIQYPLALAVNADDQIFLADRNLPGVWRLDQEETELYFAASKQFRTPLNAVRCLAIDREGHLLAGDSATRQIFRFDEMGQPEPLAKPISGPLKLGPLGIPMSIAANSQNEIFVTDLEFHCIWKLASDGGEPTKFADLQAPIGICIGEDDHIWVVSRVEGQLHRFTPDGMDEVIVEGTPFSFPHNVALDGEGRAYVVDGYGKVVWRVTPGQPPEKWFQHDRLVNPVDIKRSGDEMLIVDPRAKAIFRVQPDGSATVMDLE